RQHRCVEAISVVRLGKGADLRIPGPRLDLRSQGRRLLLAGLQLGGVTGALRQRDRPVQCHPAPELAVGVVLALPLEFPDAVVGFTTQLPDAVGEALDHVPELGGDEATLALVDGHAVDHRPEDVELALAGGAVADAYRPGAFVAGEVLEEGFGEMRVTVDAIKD